MAEQKEVTPVTPSTQKQTIKKVDYKDATKKSLIQKLKETLPKTLTPTKRFGKIFGAIFVLILIISGLNFPVASLMSGNMDVTIDIGYPLHFLKLGLQNQDDFPLLPTNLVLDMIMYIILAYIIDILLKLILNNGLFKPKEKLEEKPTIFKNQTTTIETQKSAP